MKTILNINNKPFESKNDAESTVVALKHMNPNATYEISKLESGYVIIDTLENNNLEKDDLKSSIQPQVISDETSVRDTNLKLRPSLLNQPHKLLMTIAIFSTGSYLKTSFDLSGYEQYAQQIISDLAMAIMLISPVPILTHLWNKISTTYYVNENEIRVRKGIIGRKGDSIMPEDIRKIELDQTFIQRMFNVGDIGLSSSGTEEEKIVFKGIRNPVKIRSTINKLSKELKLRKQKF